MALINPAPGRDPEHAVVWLLGEHDLTTVAALSDTLARAIAVDDADLVVDLSEVQLMSAATVGVLVRTREFLTARSRDLVLRSPTGLSRLVLDACGLGDLLRPRSSAGTRVTGPAAALGTWVEVPATDRADGLHAERPPSDIAVPLTTVVPARLAGPEGS